MTRLGVWYDFRNPVEWRLPWGQLYRDLLDQASLAEELGYDSIWVSEHHFTDDGYLPAITPMLAALARSTTRVRLGTAVILAPLYHPIRLAEELAVVDQLSDGRLEVGLAPGYRPEEFTVMGVPHHERGRRTDELLEILPLAWKGEPFDYRGKHFEFSKVQTLPPPVRPGGPPIWIGGSSRYAARRAARFGCGFMPDSGAPGEVYDLYRKNLDPTATPHLATNRVIFAADSRREALEQAGPYLLYQFNGYRKWFSDAEDQDSHGGMLTDPEQLSRQHYFLGTPDQIVESIRESQERYAYEELIFWARPPGMPLDVSSRSLRLIAEHVLPEVAQ